MAFGCCIVIFVAEAPIFLSPCHWGLALLQEQSFSCDGEFGVGVRGSADDVDNHVGDDIDDGFGGSVTSTGSTELSGPWIIGGVAWSCLNRGLLAALEEETPLFFLVIAAAFPSLLYYCWCSVGVCC